MLIVSVAGAAAYLRISEHQKAEAQTTEAATDLPANSAPEAFGTDLAVAVEGVEVLRDTLVMTVGAPAEVVSRQSTVVRAQVAGMVRAVRVRARGSICGGGGWLPIELWEVLCAPPECGGYRVGA